MAIAHALWIEHFGAELGDIERTDVGGLLQTFVETRVFRTTWSDNIEVGGGRFSVDAQPKSSTQDLAPCQPAGSQLDGGKRMMYESAPMNYVCHHGSTEACNRA